MPNTVPELHPEPEAAILISALEHDSALCDVVCDWWADADHSLFGIQAPSRRWNEIRCYLHGASLIARLVDPALYDDLISLGRLAYWRGDMALDMEAQP